MSSLAHRIVLGIDYGKKSVGIATGQRLTGTATELATLRCDETRRSREALLQDLVKIIQEWKPAVLVVGWPLNMDDTESELCAEVNLFAEKLTQATGGPVEFMDERLTSREAKNEKKQYSGFRQAPVDALAAKILLESWLRDRGSGLA